VSVTIRSIYFILYNHSYRDEEDDDGEVVKEEKIPESDNEKREDEIAEIAVRYDVVDGQPTLKSDKEKECWALFKKMTAKGVSVTFDTVLRFENINKNTNTLKKHSYHLYFVVTVFLTTVSITI
jgi:hypothetical protein